MWCRHCQQDVPAVAAPGGIGKVVCARCQQELGGGSPAHVTAICDHGIPLDDHRDEHDRDPVAELSDWQTEQRFRHLARTLRNATGTSRIVHRAGATSYRRFDPPQDLPADTEPISVHSSVSSPNRAAANRYLPSRRSTGGQVLAWLIVLCGFLAFCCGAAVISWAIVDEIPLYWDIGTAMALVGQGLLIAGLVLVLSRLWRSSCYANHKLHEIHWQLGEVQRTAQTIVGLRNGNAPAFYAELARGASPQMLLASLRGQLEQLSARVNGDGR